MRLSPRAISLRDVESDLFVQVSSLLVVGNVPEEIIEAIRWGRMTASSKPDGGVCERVGRGLWSLPLSWQFAFAIVLETKFLRISPTTILFNQRRV